MHLKERSKPKTLSCSGNVENVQIFLSSSLVVLVILQVCLQHQYFVCLVGSLVRWFGLVGWFGWIVALVGLLVGLVGWLVGWLVGLIGCLVGWLVGWFCWLVDLTGWLVGWLVSFELDLRWVP